jgi:hypothetical protein
MGEQSGRLTIKDLNSDIRTGSLADICCNQLLAQSPAHNKDAPSMIRPGNLANVFIDLSVIPLHLSSDQARSLHIPFNPGNSSADAKSVIP